MCRASAHEEEDEAVYNEPEDREKRRCYFECSRGSGKVEATHKKNA